MEYQKTHRAAVTSVAANAVTPQTLLAANMLRIGFVVHNTSAGNLYVKLGTGASTTDYTYLLASGWHLESMAAPYTGIITALWATADNPAKVTELLE